MLSFKWLLRRWNGTVASVGLAIVLFVTYVSLQLTPHHRYPVPAGQKSLPGTVKAHRTEPRSLSAEDFAPSPGYFFNDERHSRYESAEAWRSPDSFAATYPGSKFRPRMPELSAFRSKSQYMRQPIVADFPTAGKESRNMFLCLRGEGTTLWKRMPVQFLTTVPRLRHFGLYADRPAAIVGHEVYDTLSKLSKHTLSSADLQTYRRYMFVHENLGIYDSSEVKGAQANILDKYTAVPMLAHAYRTAPSTTEWFVLMQASSFVFMDVLASVLNTLDPTRKLLIGHPVTLSDSDATKFRVPDCASLDGAVVISRGAMSAVFDHFDDVEAQYEKLAALSPRETPADIIIAHMFHHLIDVRVSHTLGRKKLETKYLFTTKSYYLLPYNKLNWCHPIVSFGSLTNHDIEVLWEYERLRGPHKASISYTDLYRDFVHPYLQNSTEHWNNRAAEQVFAEKPTDQSEHKKFLENYDIDLASASLDDQRILETAAACAAQCIQDPACLSWRYIPEPKICSMSTELILGRPVYKFMRAPQDQTEMVSGWRLDRLRHLRSMSACDALYKKPANFEELSDLGTDRSHGWWLREEAHRDKSGTHLPLKQAIELAKMQKIGLRAHKTDTDDYSSSRSQAEHQKQQRDLHKFGFEESFDAHKWTAGLISLDHSERTHAQLAIKDK